MGTLIAFGLVVLVIFLVMVAISRWIFRINAIVQVLEEIRDRLPKRPIL